MSEFCLKNNTVLVFKEEGGVPVDIAKIVNPELLPIKLQKDCTFEKLKEWFERRGMPKDREGKDAAIEQFGADWATPLNGLGLYKDFNYQSLSDQYWVKKRDETWKKINFFTNPYTSTIGDMMLKPWTVTEKIISHLSPELTTTGLVRKRWRRENDGNSYLVKAGSYALKQEPLNEVLVSTLIEKLESDKIKSAGYDLTIEGVTMCSKCKNFITEDNDMVTADEIYHSEERAENEGVYDHLIRMCEKFGIPGAKDYIDWLLWIDSYTGNSDRHLNKIAFVRDINTLKVIGPTPAFDFGNSFWDTKKVMDPTKNKLFDSKAKKIIAKLTKSTNLNKLIYDTSYEILINLYPDISDEKKENLIKAIQKRNRDLQDLDEPDR